MPVAEATIQEKLTRILALTKSPNENEAQAAMEKLQQLLTKHNLELADLETQGQSKPGIKEKSHDLGRAAFRWKLNLAETIAEHFYCHPIIDYKEKTVKFVGRPYNVDSLKMLYTWIIDQIKEISKQARYVWMEESGEHVDPLRWQLNFGLGIVERLGVRLSEMRRRMAADENMNALVIHHDSEISDYFEEKYGFRRDGKKTKKEQQWAEEWAAKEAADKLLKETNLEAYYEKYSWSRPEAIAAQRLKDDEWMKAWNKKQARRKGPAYRPERPMTAEQIRREEQAWSANLSGRDSAGKVNLQPFIDRTGTMKAKDALDS